MLPEAVQVADPFHVVKLANSKLDECRRRVQNATMGHRGHKADPLYRCRRLLIKPDERLEEHGRVVRRLGRPVGHLSPVPRGNLLLPAAEGPAERAHLNRASASGVSAARRSTHSRASMGLVCA